MRKLQSKPHRTKQLFHWIQTHRLTTIIVISVVLISSASVAAYVVLNQPTQTQPVAITQPQLPPTITYHSPLTGVKVKNKTITTRAVTAVMIENSPAARPQSGLKQAGVVFEAVAEGGVTRFSALYQEDKPKIIGPVRSLRPYFLSWVAPFNASIAHVGGSYLALKEVRNGKYRDIDQFFNAATYWRSPDRYAPHNVYTNFKRLDSLNKKKGYTTSKFTGFERTDGNVAKKPTATRISIDFSSSAYNTLYSFDKKHNRYKRSLAGSPHVDREEGRIAPSVVVAMKVNMRNSSDGYHQAIDTVGSGTAIIFQNGNVIKGKWSKKSQTSQLVFNDSDGEKITLVRGQTWIAAVPNNAGSVTWK